MAIKLEHSLDRTGSVTFGEKWVNTPSPAPLLTNSTTSHVSYLLGQICQACKGYGLSIIAQWSQRSKIASNEFDLKAFMGLIL